MTSAEYELTKPKWAPLDNPTAFNLPSGSIGHYLLTEYGYLLGGRLRPVTIFDQVPAGLRHPGLWTEARNRGLSDVGEVLRLTENELFLSNFSFRFVEELHDYVEGLAIPPHAQLVNAVFMQERPFTPFPPGLEEEFIQTVEGQLDTLGQRRRAVLVCRYGLDDGINRTLIKTAAIFNISRERVRRIEARALRMLRRPSRASHLEMFMPFPEDSLGRAIFGPRLRRYLHLAYDLQLPDPAARELERYGISPRLWLNQLKRGITDFQQSNIDQIAVWLDHGLSDLQKPTTPDVPEKKYANNLLPDLPITNKQLAAIGSRNVSEAGLPIPIALMLKRHFLPTLGDILALTPLEFAGVSTLGPKRASQLGAKLDQLLKLPQDQYPGDYLARLLENIVTKLKGQAIRAKEKALRRPGR